MKAFPRSIAGIAMAPDGRLFVAKRKPGGAIGLKWEFPGGKLEEGESDEAALRREFQEEFGIDIEPVRLIGCSNFESDSGPRELAAWLVKMPARAVPAMREHSQVAWLRLDDIRKIDLADSDKGILDFLSGAIN
jgi:8-oxo-dGTP diphosphatase